jgi:hypothetical protein
VQASEADRFAATILPIIESIKATGVSSLSAIAVALNNRGIRSARGGSAEFHSRSKRAHDKVTICYIPYQAVSRSDRQRANILVTHRQAAC